MGERAPRSASNQRSVARKLAVQALYRWQMNECPWQDLVLEFADAEDMPKADREYFDSLVGAVVRDREALDLELAAWMDRKPSELDPIEHAVLLIGTWELRARPDVPFRVVLSEAVSLARRFGATDGHKFVNAVLDRGARALRALEH
jgi:N utilization substance protein B